MTTDPWFETLRRVLHERGVGCTDDGKLVLLKCFREAEQPPQAAIDVYNARAEWRRVYPTLKRNWISDLRHSISRLLANNSTDAHALRTVFWLRLHGVLVDLRQGPAFDVVNMNEKPPKPGSDLAKLAEWVSAVDGVHGALTENELLWAEYRRHVEAHVYQGAYEPQLNKRNSTAKEKFTSKYTEKTYEVYDLDKRLGAVLAAHRNDESVIALDFAQRLREPVERLYVATELMFA